MTKTPMYTYLGTNGTICSHVYLEGVYHIKKWRLTSDIGKLLTTDNEHFTCTVTVPENEIGQWFEVDENSK